MNADGTGSTSLTTSGWDSDPALSPDGRKIAFASSRDAALNPSDNLEIYVMDSDGTFPHRLTEVTKGAPLSKGVGAVSPAWSPDSTKITYAVTTDGPFHHQIYLMKADGSGQSRLTNLPDGARQSAWSPNGESIAFSTDREDGKDQIYIVKTDGTSLRRITTEPACCPTWSPDGKKIAFARGRIFTIDVEGGHETMLTRIGSDDHPAWSPDGKAIAFTRSPANPWSQGFFHFQIYVMNADGTGVKQLTNNGAENRAPTWSRTA